MLTSREVPLGGLRAMPVRRTLPQRQRSLIGAWCFLDHYGPDDTNVTGGMDVAPHPHTGLQTVSWLFEGEIEHRDTTGVHAMVRPAEVNLMTAGRGIAHSEVSTTAKRTLHGAQLWVALPDNVRHTDPGFEHYAPTPFDVDGARITVFLGSLAGDTSPVRHLHAAARRRDHPRTGNHAAARRRPDLRARRPRRHRRRDDARHPPQSRRTRLSHARSRRVAPDQPHRATGADSAAGRSAVRRGDPHVVELRRPHQRRNHPLSASSGSTRSTPSTRGRRTGPASSDSCRDYVGGPIPAPTLPSVPIKPRR